MKVKKKVNYSEYKGKYNKSIKERLEKAPERVDVETLRAYLYGYTYTKEYAARFLMNFQWITGKNVVRRLA